MVYYIFRSLCSVS